METITNAASAASKAVFGEPANKEPVSGAQGDTTKGEPYDAGNLGMLLTPRFARLCSNSTRKSPNTNMPPDADSQEKLEKRLSGDDDDATRSSKPHASEVHESTRTEPVGPGPKPVDVVAREHGGDAGAVDKPALATDDVTTTAKDDDKKDDESKKPAGQEVVHASGFAAEGGDFDASNPGAGKEADRKSLERV